MPIKTEEIPLVDLRAQYNSIRRDIDAAIQRVLDTTAFIMGPEVAEFERAFAAYCGVPHAIGVSSGTDALHLALRACGVGPGDEVITTPFTFIATVEAILMTGARPVFCDIDPRTYNIDPARIESVLTRQTKAILPVHLYGQPADMDAVNAIASRHRVHVVEDAAQAHGAGYKGRTVGTLAEAACFSFYPGKNLGAYGDAGAVVTTSAELGGRIRMLRDHGRRKKYEHEIAGFGNRLDTLQASVLAAKLPHLAGWTERRRHLAALYTRRLSGTAVKVASVPAWAEPVWHLYVVEPPDREAARTALKNAGISSGVHYPIPLHLQPACADLGYARGAFPHSEHAAASVLSIPLYPELGEREVERICDVLLSAVS